MRPARERVKNKVGVDVWNIYRKEWWVFNQAEVLVEFQIEDRVDNRINVNVKEQVRNKLR